MKPLKRRDFSPLVLVIAAAGMWMLLHALLGGSFLGPSLYNSYTRQAMAWRQGLLHLPENVPYLELAVFGGEYYVSFPPVPSLVLWPLTFLFGMDTPDSLLMKMYALFSCLLVNRALKRAGYRKIHAGAFAFLFCFASSLLPLTLDGAVWYHAQVLAFFLIIASLCLMAEDRPTPALLCYALAVGCRPFDALYFVPLFYTWWSLHRKAGVSWKETLRPLLPGVALGLLAAFLLGAYNAVRFDNPFEFGHNYLPEFSTQGGVQFSLAHIANNLKTFLWGLPLERGENGIRVKTFGYSMLLACPALTLMLAWAIVDLCKKRFRREKAAVLASCLFHAFLLLLHRTFGGYQLGARYAVDLMPYAFFYLLLTPEKNRIHGLEYFILIAVFLFTGFGMYMMH